MLGSVLDGIPKSFVLGLTVLHGGVVGRLQQRAWTAEDGSARQVVEVVAEELGPSLRWATATPARSAELSPTRI